MSGSTIADTFEVLRPLGAGGMGVVHVARHQRTGRLVALKVLTPALVGGDPSFIERFRREASAAGRVESNHVATIVDAGVDASEGSPYIAMELLSGEDLGQALSRVGRLSPVGVLKVAAQACRGLAAAHAAGVVHRDVKPSNLFLHRADGGQLVVKLLDFGIAKVESADGMRLTKTGRVIGTPAYMSPEQALSKPDVDARSDLWSLGVAMYRAMTGATPYRAKGGGDLIVEITTAGPPPLRTRAPWVTDAMAAVVDRALSVDRSRRFQSAEEMHAAIYGVLPAGDERLGDSDLASFVPPEDLGATAFQEQPTVALGGPRADGPPASASRSGKPVAAVAVAMVVFAAAGAWLAFGRGPTAAAPSASFEAPRALPVAVAAGASSGTAEPRASASAGPAARSSVADVPSAKQPSEATASPTGSHRAAPAVRRRADRGPAAEPATTPSPRTPGKLDLSDAFE